MERGVLILSLLAGLFVQPVFAELLVECGLNDPQDLVIVERPRLFISDRSCVRDSQEEWSTWYGYAPVSPAKADFGLKRNVLLFQYPHPLHVSEDVSIWFSATLDFQTPESGFCFTPLGGKKLLLDKEEDSISFNYFAKTGVLQIKIRGGNRFDGPNDFKTGQYLILGCYHFKADGQTHFEFALIPEAFPQDLSAGFSFEEFVEGVFIGAITTTKVIKKYGYAGFTMGRGNSIGNLRIGTEYADVIGASPKKLIAHKSAEDSSIPLEAVLPERQPIPRALFLLAGVGGGGFLAILIYIFIGIYRRSHSP